MSSPRVRRRLLATEVIQTSAMDCGPAALKCLLEGFGTPVSYGRLREACQTDVDGTSIDTLEAIATQLGLEAEQVMLPIDHLLLPEAKALPAMVVVQLSSGLTHVVVVWRRHGPLVQLMDPATGRRWLTGRQFLKDVYLHEMQVSASDWHEWARSPEFLIPLGRRLRDLGLAHRSDAFIAAASAAEGWLTLATLDAATRLTRSLVQSTALRAGREAGHFLQALLRRAAALPGQEQNVIPARYWSARPGSDAERGGMPPPEAEIWLKGAVLIRVRGPRSDNQSVNSDSAEMSAAEPGAVEIGLPSPTLTAALEEAPAQPLLSLFRLLRGYGVLAWSVLGLGLVLAAGTLIFEVLLLRGALDFGYSVNLIPQRLLSVGCFLAYVLLVVVLELHLMSALLHLGRRLETQLRAAVFEAIPQLADQYFRSRPVSDMAERAHDAHQLRMLPRLGGQFVRASLGLLVTGSALVWLYPQSLLIIALAIGCGLLLPLAFAPHLQELDLRVRTHTGALTRFYLDALLGLTALRAHCAEHAMLREQENLLVEWYRSSQQRVRSNVFMEGLQAVSGFGFAVWLLFSYAYSGGDPAGAILLAYLALNLPVLGEEIALLVRQYPIHRNLILRLLELLNAPTVPLAEPTHPPSCAEPQESNNSGPASLRQREIRRASPAGVTVVFDAVTVRSGGHLILDNLDLRIDAGEHVGIVGSSGAGKSTLAGLLLGWHYAASGQLLVDGSPLDQERLEQLREATVWIDPGVQLWNHRLLANLTYGANHATPAALLRTLHDVELLDLVERLSAGLQTRLGEGGGLISGGEGQRVRVARGLLHSPPRLVVLDEPFRGLERNRRESLLKLARKRWRHATLLCITHDVAHTLDFDRVLVLAGGRIVDHGAPALLAGNPLSPYRSFLDIATQVRAEFWANTRWRRIDLRQGRLRKAPDRHAGD